ncbi:MAG TPA: hypothetical protein VG265_04505 [Gaiellaceae bacterium]|jgi:hypothetical protein|nr:hypothetical protein [Gaiellaceae bacterium]
MSAWFDEHTLHERKLELERSSRTVHGRRRPAPEVRLPAEPVLLRLCTVHDDGRLDELAELETRPHPVGRYVVAEIEGIVVAALPLGAGPPLADPFRATAHLVPLLELRRAQLDRDEARGWGALWATLRGWRHAGYEAGE